MAKTKKINTEHTNLVDNAFTVGKARWGTYQSYDKDGVKLVTSLTEEQCVAATRFYLASLQDGSFSDNNVVTYSSEV
jgi:hypothetical protein